MIFTVKNSYLIKGGRIIDPDNGRDETADLLISNGLITPLPDRLDPNTTIIDATGCVVCPGLIDLHVHFREPGGEAAETIETGSQAAAAGGFTTVVTMPNTNPPTDTSTRISEILAIADSLGTVNVLPSGCITLERRGAANADLAAMKKAGASAFTDDGSTVPSDNVMRNAMAEAAKISMPLMDHALNHDLAGNGVLRQHPRVSEAGLPGIPAQAEIEAVERDIRLAEETGCALHIQHLSTKESVDLIRKAQKRGINVSTEASPHHLALTIDDIEFDDTNFKMNPPLGTLDDQKALIDGIMDGTIGAFATDHAPHTQESKSKGMIDAPFGIIGLEIAVGVTYTTMVKNGTMSINDWLKRWTIGPAKILGITPPNLSHGTSANVTILDLQSEWNVNPDRFASKSRNTPFIGHDLIGQAIYTFCNGKMTNKPK